MKANEMLPFSFQAEEMGMASSVELCVKALQLPRQDDLDTRISVCKTVTCLLPDDLEVLRGCLLTEFLLGPCQEVFGCLEEVHLRPDQKYDQEKGVIPNSLRCELLLALKAYWPFDPEFWDWKTLKYHCVSLLGLMPESEGEEEDVVDGQERSKQRETECEKETAIESEHHYELNGHLGDLEQHDENANLVEESEAQKLKFCCQICKRSVSDTQIVHHSKRHAEEDNHPCPVCLERFKSRKELVPHVKEHIQNHTHFSTDCETKKDSQEQPDEDEDIEPGEITVDPSLMLYYKSTHDPDVLHHIVQQAKSLKAKHVDDDDHVTFDYVEHHFNLQNRDVYPCPGSGCKKTFKHSKYLYVHLKSEHKGDENVKHFHEMRDKREKCAFCRRHFVSAYHHRKHRRVHYGDQPYTCVVMGCGAQFGSSNELLVHKQTHGYQLNYQCELNGCYITYSDLGQMYHHEAQHFRDAAFTCSSPGCKKFYFSKRELVQHLSTHNITFTEDDFEAQRKSKRKRFKIIPEEAACLKKSEDTATGPEENVSVDDLTSSPVSCSSSLQSAGCKEPKGTMTLVAVCFDGSKFTCGFEKCGMTFSRARDVQRHLKCAHREHLKLENREFKHDKERGPNTKGPNTDAEANGEEKGENKNAGPLQLTEGGNERNAPSHLKQDETNSSTVAKNDVLSEILIGLSQLDLNSGSESEPSEPAPSALEPQTSLHKDVLAKPPVSSLQKRPTQSDDEEAAKAKCGEPLVTADQCSSETLATAKPYICHIESCGFRTAQSYSLLRHYKSKHRHTIAQARMLTSLKTTSFKPYACQLCSKTHREKSALKAHYLHMHKLSKALVERISCTVVQDKGSKATEPTEHPPQSLTNHTAIKKEWDQAEPVVTSAIDTNEPHSDNHSPSEEEAENDAGDKKEDGEKKGDEAENGTAHQGRTPRRLVAKNNLCYILDKFSKPFHCVVRDCDAAFSTQGGLVRHLQLVHHYNRSQLLLEKDVDTYQNAEVRKEPAKKRPVPNSDEPQPQYKCHFANCTASYHLKSSLVRHTREFHSPPPELIQCKYEGCTRVFSQPNALKKHILYCHYEYYDSLVLRLQSTHKNSVSGCQKKLIVTAQSPQKDEPDSPNAPPGEAKPEEAAAQSEETGEAAPEDDSASDSKEDKNQYDSFVYRSHEEALQMCQDRCLRVGYPCMVQDCDSVVRYMKSMQRHYIKVHGMSHQEFVRNEDKLVFNAEQLEELIQRKSARPTVACQPNGVQKMEYQAEPENPEGQSTPMSLHSISMDTQEDNQYPLDVKEEVPPTEKNSVVLGTADVIYGEPSTEHPEEPPAPTETQSSPKQEETLSLQNIKALLRPVTVDLSPPSSLRLRIDEGFLDAASGKDASKVTNGSASALPTTPVRQPLKRKNELPEQPSNLKEAPPCSPSPRTFDIATYKPMGFESSFLKFIQDTTPKDKDAPVKRRDTFRRSCSVKENNQLGISHTRNKRTHSPLLKPLALTGDLSAVQNLKSILDKALAGCGDLAIKQLQYLRPVVVLERPVYPDATALPELFPSDTSNGKMLLGS
ncbi:zinc finger protein Rlf isoform X2 [Genypterus blacodes]|uniref:zinc finger protein Rlf isoform X2 n=1 Tax=Genypterus blacodes TaxID=154954 RepID=UPI003F77714F